MLATKEEPKETTEELKRNDGILKIRDECCDEVKWYSYSLGNPLPKSGCLNWGPISISDSCFLSLYILGNSSNSSSWLILPDLYLHLHIFLLILLYWLNRQGSSIWLLASAWPNSGLSLSLSVTFSFSLCMCFLCSSNK